jgi:hypothetical protein
MPYIDNELVLSDEQVVTASAASTNVIDMGAAAASDARALKLAVDVTEAGDSAGDTATLTIALQTSSTEGFDSPVTLAQSAAIAQTALTLGARAWEVTLPRHGLLRYVRAYYTVGTENLTKGKFKAFLALET